jgi:hypothetical protein
MDSLSALRSHIAAFVGTPLAKAETQNAVYRFPHEPTPAQIKAGNYGKRKVAWNGLTISIENEAGSFRRGVDRDGHAWGTRMVFPYGYVLSSLGVDGDHVDCYLGPDETAPMVYIIHQRKAGAWDRYDEDKAMLQFASQEEAERAYLLHYDDPRFLGPVTAMPVEEFKQKVLAADGRMVKAEVRANRVIDPVTRVARVDFDHSLDFGQHMLKSEHGPIPAGAHWVTVHSHPGAKGSPILVMPHEDGSMRVIGGAGGALNHLKLRSVKTGESYKDSIKQRGQARQEAKKKQIEADKAAGIHNQKQAEKGALKESVKKQREEFVKTVADVMGWDDKSLAFDEEAHAGLSEEAQAKARKEHDKDIFHRAKAAVEMNRKNLVEDHEALAASGLGEIPLTDPSPDQISVADLDPMPEKTPGLGFSQDFGKRAADKGLTPESVEAELTNVHGADAKSPDELAAQASKAAEKKDLAAGIAKEVEDFKLANPETVKPQPKVLDDAKKAAALVKAQKKLKMLEMAARHASMELDGASVVESKAHILEVSDADVEDAARKQMEQDIKTIGAVGLLSEIDKMGGEESLGGHVGAGAFNALNAFAQAAAGDSMIDRSVVDVLGISAASQIIARRIHKDYEAGDLDRIRQGAENYHVQSQNDIQQNAVKQARELADAAGEIEMPEGKTGYDLATAQEANHKRREAVMQAKRVLGQATGQLQAGASLVMALREGAKDHVEVSLGKVDPKSAITKLHALGLKSGDYKLESVNGNLVTTITGEGLDRLAAPVDVEGMKQISRNMDIISGKHDEDGWLPKGFANRPDLAMKAEPGVAERLAQPFKPGADLAQSLRDYIGGRAADGDSPADILADIQSGDFHAKSGDPEAYRAALDSVAPLKSEDGKMRPVESLAGEFEKMADDYVGKMGGDRSPLHRQKIEINQKSVDALHRALSETPEGVAAFKPIGDLSAQERTGLRKWFNENLAKVDEAGKAARDEHEAHLANEPEKESVDMFGETSTTPEWSAWNAKRDELSQVAGSSGLDWNKYVGIMGSPENAIKSVQDLVRSHVVSKFAEVHNTLNKKNPLKVGKTVIAGNLNHLDAVDPAARAKREESHRALVDSLRERAGGKYSSGSVADKIEAQQEAKAAFEQSQMGFFSTEEDHLPDAGKKVPLGADERHTLGHAAEQQIAGMMSVVGKNFKPGHPTKLWQPSMNDKYTPQQRAIKHIEANKRTVLSYGAGSGKTGIYLGAFSHLHETGKIKRALMLVPSVVQGQFGGEALRYLEPGKFNWHCQPGASQAERIAAYKNPDHHFAVMTHESFRADMQHLGAKHAGITESEMNAKLSAMTPAERKTWAKEVMDKEGMNFDATMVDEAHQIVNRAGKENSARSNVIDAVSDNAEYHVYGSGDPIKNDSSEIHDVMAKMDRERYGDRAAFMRKYGGDTIAAKAALKREMARHVISNTIAPDVDAQHEVHQVELSAGQKSALAALDKSMSKAKAAKTAGKVDVASCKAISPDSFDGVPEEQHEAIAKNIQESLGIIKESAASRIINTHPDNAKIDKVMELVGARKGKPGVVFAHSRAAVAEIEKRLKAAGHRVVTITGSDSAQDKDAKRKQFNPESGEASADIMVASDAAAVGLNLQRGNWLIQHDSPNTAMVHGQRNARIHRLGQKNNVELLDVVANHKSEKAARDRLAKKHMLREFMTDPMDGLDDTGIASFIKPKTDQPQASMF